MFFYKFVETLVEAQLSSAEHDRKCLISIIRNTKNIGIFVFQFLRVLMSKTAPVNLVKKFVPKNVALMRCINLCVIEVVLVMDGVAPNFLTIKNQNMYNVYAHIFPRCWIGFSPPSF